MLCVVSSAFSPPLPLSSISPPLPPSPSTTWPSTRRWRLDRDEMYANARLGSRTFRVCCVIIRKGRSGRRGEGVRRREDWSCNRDRNRRRKRNVPVSINWDVRGTIRCDTSDVWKSPRHDILLCPFLIYQYCCCCFVVSQLYVYHFISLTYLLCFKREKSFGTQTCAGIVSKEEKTKSEVINWRLAPIIHYEVDTRSHRHQHLLATTKPWTWNPFDNIYRKGHDWRYVVAIPSPGSKILDDLGPILFAHAVPAWANVVITQGIAQGVSNIGNKIGATRELPSKI